MVSSLEFMKVRITQNVTDSILLFQIRKSKLEYLYLYFDYLRQFDLQKNVFDL